MTIYLDTCGHWQVQTSETVSTKESWQEKVRHQMRTPRWWDQGKREKQIKDVLACTGSIWRVFDVHIRGERERC